MRPFKKSNSAFQADQAGDCFRSRREGMPIVTRQQRDVLRSGDHELGLLMPIIGLIGGLAAVVWCAIYARRGSLVIGCGLLVAIAYVVGYEFWHAQFGPLPVTLDRIALAGLLATAAVQWKLGRLQLKTPVGADWLLVALLTYFVASIRLAGPPEIAREGGSALGRFVASFALPALLYVAARQANVSRREWCGLLAILVVLGTYLSLTAICEITGTWSLVFPRYIADPNLGIHFGRARGPGLNAASLGIYITACLWCAWTLLQQTVERRRQLALLLTLPLMAVGVFSTYTRSTWLGLVASGLIVGAFYVPRRWRLPIAGATASVAFMLVALSWSTLVGLEREGSAAEAQHSVNQRASFVYVSWQMFRDYPLCGVGFGRFYQRKMPYLSDRRQTVELESIRALDHHNTFLSVLVETGVIGFALFCGVFIAWMRYAWSLASNLSAPTWMQCHGVLTLALIVNYVCSAVFHDLTLVPTQHWLLFVFAGLTLNLAQGIAPSSGTANTIHRETLKEVMQRSPTYGAPSSINLFGMHIDRITMRETVDRVLSWCGEPRGDTCRFVVTPNVDHAVMFQERPDLRTAYAAAALVLADGAPIVLASRIIGQNLPERVAGSDLVPRILATTEQRLTVFLLGAAPGVAEVAAANIGRQWPHVEIVGTYSPPLGFEDDAAENGHILARIAAAAPDLLIVGFGAPKQELWIHRHQHQLEAKVALCAGATIDFLAGNRHRSPVWMREAGLEWLHRVLAEPRRLAGRYARDAWVFPQLLWREWRRIGS
jgi:N-acetylglucosaminyldiphosphoundecaprenol N-acetyl-beta-D-mannosaminyltransferase